MSDMTLSFRSFTCCARRRQLALAVLASAALAGCATQANVAQEGAAAPVAAPAAPAALVPPVIAVPPASVGTWYDLGQQQAPWLSGDAPVASSGATVPTRVAGLRREDGHWLAIVIAQVAPAGSAPCPLPTSLTVEDSGGPDGCLRMRRNADFDHWLEQQHMVLFRWLASRGWQSLPRAWTAYRVPAATGQLLEVTAVVDPSLIEPATRNNTDFLVAGVAGTRWAHDLARAAREASGGGTLKVPAFPFAPAQRSGIRPNAAAPAERPHPATQVITTPRPPVQAPRSDRQ